MRKALTIVLAVLFVFSLAACGGGNQPANTNSGGNTPAPEQTPAPAEQASGEPIRIGAVISESGPSAPLGKPEMETIRMLVDEANANGGINGRPIELFAYDDKSDQNEAVLITKRLIEQDKVVAIIGGTSSGNSMAMIPQMERDEMPYISLAASKQVVKPSDGSPRKWTFKSTQGDDIVVPRALQYLKDHGLTNIAFLSVANPFGSNGYAEFQAAKDEYGITELIHEEFEATVTDASAMLTRVKRAEPQAIIIWGTTQESAVVTRNIRDLGIDIPVINSHGIGDPKFFELAGPASNGILFPAGRLLVVAEVPDSHPQKEVLVGYREDFKAKYNYEASTFGGHAWDAFYMLVAALENAGDDKEAIRSYLETNIKDFVGISGVYNMTPEDHNGLTADSLAMIEIKDGKWTLKE